MDPEIVQALGAVYDPCCREKRISVVDMGLVHAAEVEGRTARVELLLTSGWCPFAAQITTSVHEAVEAIPGIDRAAVEIIWDEAWTMERLSDAARAKLVFLPPPAAVPDRGHYIAEHSSTGPQSSGEVRRHDR